MTEILPATMDALPALGGQAALFDDPDTLLTLPVGDLRSLAVKVGERAVGMLAEMRRYVGLLAWAGWHRLPSTDYTAFVAALAKDAGVTARSVETWRDAQVTAGGLSVPASVEARKRRPREESAGRGHVFEVSSNVSAPAAPIPTTSKDVTRDPDPSPTTAVAGTPAEGPAGPPDRRGQEGATARPGPDRQGAQTGDRGVGVPADALTEDKSLVDGETHDLIDWRAAAATPLPGPMHNEDGVPLAPTTRLLVERLIDAMGDLAPADFWNEATPDERTMFGDYVNEVRDVRGQEPSPAPAKRRSGYKVTPEDRKSAKERDEAIDPTTCPHPREKRKQLAYGNFCGDCKTKVA